MTDARSPKTISGLVGWYTGLSAEVTSGSVSSWKDISGQGNHATTILGSPKVDSVGVTSPTPGSPAVAFHYGNFDNHYGDGTRANAAKAGRIYADTLSAEIPPEFGSLVSASTASGQTTYSWFPAYSVIADVLVVAGGGGVPGDVGGGGGAGGVVYHQNQTLNSASYTIKVGKGGAGSQPGPANNVSSTNGLNSSISTLSPDAVGGGRGALYRNHNGGTGGSGGGASDQRGPGAGTAGQGFSGGTITTYVVYATTGGGGAGGAGGNINNTNVGSNGGTGVLMSVFGETYGENGWFGGGGGGGGTGGVGAGGLGGGGDGKDRATVSPGNNGQPHTGGGGGGNAHPHYGGADGGSGIVLLLLRNAQGRGPTQFPFLWGGTGDRLRFPTTVMSADSPNYTLFHVARYYKPTGAPTRGRIFDGLGNNWLSGFWNGRSGVAYHEGWVTPQSDLHGNQWVLSTDQRLMYRSNGTNRTTGTGTESTTLTINYGNSSDKSDWAVAEVIVFNRELTSAEYLSVEAYLSAKYFNSGVVPATGVISGSLLNALFYRGIDGGYPLSIPLFGQRLGVTLGTILRASHFRGVGLGGALDTVPLPAAAYSLRRLFGDYGGPQVRVRRSTDNVEADIFMDKDGVIVTIENSTEKNLTTWLGGATAYVTTWYDQSGNGNNVTQATTSKQPKYDTTNKIEFIASSQHSLLRTPGVLAAGDDTYTFAGAFEPHATGTQVVCEQNSSTSISSQRACVILLSSKIGHNGQSNDAHNIVAYTLNQKNRFVMRVNNGVSPNIKLNHEGTNYTKTSTSPANLNVSGYGFSIGYKLSANAEYFDGFISEIIVFNTEISDTETNTVFSLI